MIRLAKNPVVPTVLAVAIFAMTSCYVDADADMPADEPDSRRVHADRHRLYRDQAADGTRIVRKEAGRVRAFIGPSHTHAPATGACVPASGDQNRR